jgi:hypothetical protein
VHSNLQVFALGKAAEPAKDFRLAELQDQLSLGLLNLEPVNAQYFVHDVKPAGGQACHLPGGMDVPALFNVEAILG